MTEISLSVKEMQNLEYGILRFIKEVCRKNNLRYYLAYGTLLGAVRHAGFIPWDDDVDIMMPRTDYERFITAAQNENHPYYKVISKETEKDFTAPLPKVIDSRIELIQHYSFIEKVVLGPYVDIFILDGCGEEEQSCGCLERCCELFRKWAIADTDFSKSDKRLRQLMRYIRHFPVKCRGYDYYLQKLERECRMYDYDNSDYVGTLMFPSIRKEASNPVEKENVWKREKFGQGTDLIFEGESFTAPVAYEEILASLYGDYMELPPENERIPNHEYTLRLPDNMNLKDVFSK